MSEKKNIFSIQILSLPITLLGIEFQEIRSNVVCLIFIAKYNVTRLCCVMVLEKLQYNVKVAFSKFYSFVLFLTFKK